jgi:predicted transcriptional regulator
MLKVRDLMSPVVLTVAADESAESAADILARAGISGAPVRDGFGDLIGIVSHADLTNERLTGGRRHPTVSDLMTPDIVGVYADDPALAAALEMARHDIHRVLVWATEGDVAGIVTSLDLVKAIARGEPFAIDAHAADASGPQGGTTWT